MKNILTLVFAVVLTSTIKSQPLSKESEKALKVAFGKDIKDYKIYSYPTNNFGVGTMCAPKWIPDGQMVADMVKFYGLNRNDSHTDTWKNVNGYAYYGDDGPQVIMNDTLKNILGLQMLLPKILKVLSIDIGFDKEKNKSISVTIDSAVKRFLEYRSWKLLVDSIKKANPDDPISIAYDRKKLWIATSDFVLLNYKVVVNRADSFGIKLGVKIDSLINIGKLTFDKDSLGLVISRNRVGEYSITSNKPLVIGVVVKKRKDVVVAGTEQGFEDWDVVPNAKLNDITKKLLGK